MDCKQEAKYTALRKRLQIVESGMRLYLKMDQNRKTKHADYIAGFKRLDSFICEDRTPLGT